MIIFEVILPIAAVVAGWIAMEFVGRPVRKFFDLRGEVIRRMTQFANVRARQKEVRDDVGATSGNVELLDLSDKENARLEEAQSVLRDLASQMRSFADNELLAVRIVRLLRYDPQNASAGLIGLSNSIDTFGGNKAFQIKTIEKALRL
ncbi:MAG: hypothetical protein HY659_12505 [Rhizobiales bacterium]|nr:hypothetical protein [Hyphomicrobiales bacterium]